MTTVSKFTMAKSVLVVLITSFIVAVFFCYRPALSQDICGYIGYTDETEATASRAQMLYLDTENSATCSGNITGFRVCYYQPEDYNSSTSRTVYRAVYAVYQKMTNDSSSSERYVRVSKSLNATVTTSDLKLSGSRDQHIAEGFNCYDDALESNASTAFLTIEEGDILGACILDPNNLAKAERLQLDIVGEESGHSLMQTSADNFIKGVIIPSVVSVDELIVVSLRKLHVYASICKFCK